MDIRKRPGQSSLTGNVESDSNVASPSKSTMIGRRKRGKSHKNQIQLPIIVILVGVAFIIYSASVVLYFTPPLERKEALHTINRVLHHDIPDILDVSSRRRVGAEYLPLRPRMMGYYYETTHSNSFLGAESMNANLHRRHKKRRTVDVSPALLEKQAALKNSRDYASGKADKFEEGDCVAQYEWQKNMYPTCNLVMEQDMTNLALNANGSMPIKMLAHGYWRDVWGLKTDSQEHTVLKTMRYEHDYEPRNYDRHRRDAVAMEELTGSQWIMDIYSFCGNSGVFEFADGGDLDDSIFAEGSDEWTPAERLVVAYQVATGIAEVHNYHKEGVAAIAHTDITTSQFVYVGSAGIFKLNDFNRCRFIRWNQKKNRTCTFKIGNNPGTFRSPEEYSYKGETEMVDIYSMGNIFYAMLTGIWPFEDAKSKKARNMIMRGYRPPINQTVLESTDPFVQTLVNATRACWIQDPKQRASARKVQKYIEGRLIQLGVPKS